MNNNKENLWGDIPTSENVMRTPYTILREQAAILSESTKGLLLGEVVPLPYHPIQKAINSLNPKTSPFINEQELRKLYGILRIKVPSINNYTYSLLEIEYPMQTYPVFISNLVGKEEKVKCENEEEFKTALRNILSSKEVKQVISTLFSQIQAEVR